MKIVMNILELYHYLNTEIADKRTNDWFFVSSLLPLTLLSSAYLYFVTQCGPRFMKDRQPYKLGTVIKLYNAFQIVANALLVYYVFDAGWYEDYFFYCVKVDMSYSPKAYQIVKIFWYIYMLKMIDYIETVFFVLRKKNNQISVLHVYHHISTCFFAWMGLKYTAHGMSLTIAVINCSVHVIMYTYYLLASFGPKIQRRIRPIKPMITVVQMVQFWVLIFYILQNYLPHCRSNMFVCTMFLANLLINFILFYNFYQKNYVSKENKKK